MTDQPQVDNLQGANKTPVVEQLPSSLQLDYKQPGPETGSTAIDLRKFADQQKAAEDPLIQALMQGMKKNVSPQIDNQSAPIVKEEPKVQIQEAKPVKEQQGFLTPFVSGFNNLLAGIWNALKSLVPMKPQTGAGPA
ncbi:hypothetical protein HZA76_00585 [Candidatus Roizmanbacteria bacterium]|nr:hypothetical protein [Candidatus Roizmanbacteria bacterium]